MKNHKTSRRANRHEANVNWIQTSFQHWWLWRVSKTKGGELLPQSSSSGRHCHHQRLGEGRKHIPAENSQRQAVLQHCLVTDSKTMVAHHRLIANQKILSSSHLGADFPFLTPLATKQCRSAPWAILHLQTGNNNISLLPPPDCHVFRVMSSYSVHTALTTMRG